MSILVFAKTNQRLKMGYYPLYRDVSSQFQDRLVAIVNNVLDVDLPAVEDVTTATIRKAKKMLMVLARDCPHGNRAVFVAANLRPEPAAFMPEVGIRIDNTKKPLLAENFKAEAEGKIRLGPYGFVVQEL